MNCIDCINIIVKFTFKTEDLAKLLDSRFSVLRVIDFEAISFIWLVVLEATIEHIGHMLGVSLIRVNFAVLCPYLFHAVIVTCPHLFHCHALLGDFTLPTNQHFFEENRHIDFQVDDLNVRNERFDKLTHIGFVSQERYARILTLL